jgi:predicted dehydrogenase
MVRGLIGGSSAVDDMDRSESMRLRVALVGCGQIADAHLHAMRRCELARVVAVCDRDPDLVRQAARRFGVRDSFVDANAMLAAVRPDVVHVTTPPAGHRAVALQALEAGAHIYLEKPFALDALETEEILSFAAAAGRSVTVGHDRLFDPAWLECRSQIARGRIGSLAHVEVTHVYDLEGPFGRRLANDPIHWVHALPGGLFQNTLSHALAVIVALAPPGPAAITLTTWDARGDGFDTDLHLLVRADALTATVTFLTRPGPAAAYARVHGSRGWLEVDYEARCVRSRAGPAKPSLLTKLIEPLAQGREAARNLSRNAWALARGRLHYFAGMHVLVDRFYRSILEGTPPPIDADHIRRSARLMDDIVRELRREDLRTRRPSGIRQAS